MLRDIMMRISKEFKEARSRKEKASGIEHMVYPSTDDPDKIYKLGPKNVIDNWYDIFKKNPNIFPIIYKRGETRVKLKDKKVINTKNGWQTFEAGTVFPFDYVLMENLDTDKVIKEWALLDRAMEEILDLDGYEFMDYMVAFMLNDDNKTVKIINEGIKEYSTIYPIFLRYVDLVNTLMDMGVGAKIPSVGRNIPDVHQNNFGYSKSGKLKCLDF
jgi:hypothetical protein